MRFKNAGNSKEDALAVIVNGEASLAIPQGAPVFLALDGNKDGLRVVSAVGLASFRYNLFYGFNSFMTLNPGDRGESIVFGFCQSIRIMKQSRAASTDDWAAWDSADTGAILDVVTEAGVQAMSVFSSGQYTQAGFFAALGESFAAGTSSASATSDTRTAIISNLKGFVRAL